MDGFSNGSLLTGGTSIWDEPGEGSFYYKIESVLAVFYLVHPKRTMYPTMDTPNFYMMGFSIAPILMIAEFILIHVKGLPRYHWNDCLAGVCAMIAATIPQVFLELAIFSLCSWIHQHLRLIDMPYDSWWTWIVCLLATDLSFYVAHRVMHEVNLAWAAHQLHHSSEYYNLFAPARNSFLDKTTFMLCTIPWAFLLPVGPLRAHHQLNLIYQYWIHTKVVGDMGPLEYILSTPTQHAIHHGRNRFCIDMNYGGFLSIWDHLFKTMVWPRDHKETQIYYGLVHPVASWDVVYLYGHTFRDIFLRFREYKGLDKLRAVINGPGWEPGKPRLGNYEEIPEEPEDKTPYDKQSPLHVYIYCTIAIAFAYYFNVAFILQYQAVEWYRIIAGLLFSTWTIASVGYILEHKPFLPPFECCRCASFFIIEWLFADILTSFGIALPLLRVWFGASLVFWVFNLDYFSSNEFTKTASCSSNNNNNTITDKVKVN